MSEASHATPLNGRPSLAADLKAGFFVFLIALPLCLAIAKASEFPPIAGVMTAIIGGLIVSPLGSARLTIKGPAAGLIVIVLGAVTELGTVNGQFDPQLGYTRCLAVGMVAAAIQILFGLLRFASVGAAMANSVVHGMMAAIGITILSKQVHNAMGVTPAAKTPLPLLAEIPASIGKANVAVTVIGVLSILVLALWPKWKKAAARVPAPLVVLALAVAIGAALHLATPGSGTLLGREFASGPDLLVKLPASLVAAITHPNFDVVFSGASIKWIVMFALVGFIESTLSTLAVDSLDPARRASNLNRDLLALGCGNLVSAAVGGLPMISEIVRSKANIDAGAQSNKANFFHGAFLLLSIVAVPWLLQMIPLSALAAMLIMVGLRLGGPKVWAHAWHVGWDQFVMFAVTVVVTLMTDLLKGVGAGLVVKAALHMLRGVRPGFFFGSRVEATRAGEVMTVTMAGAAVFTMLLRLGKVLRGVDGGVRKVVLDLRECRLIDHTFLARVEGMAAEWPQAKLEILYPAAAKAASHDAQAARWIV